MSTIHRIRLLGAAAVVALLTACAHPISLEPTQLPERVESKLVAKKVAYAISDADKAKEVTTAGGGGDKVSYFPYRDIEKALRAALRAVYQDVAAVKSATDVAGIKEAGASYVFTPQIVTNSSSPSPFTWPPTNFSAEVSCKVTDAQGALITTVTVNGQGHAEFSEFKSDFSLSARRAVADMAEKFVAELRKNDKLR